MARSKFTVAAVMAAFVFAVLALFQLVASVFGHPRIDFANWRGVQQQDGQVPFEEKWEPRSMGSQYLLGVGKADITG